MRTTLVAAGVVAVSLSLVPGASATMGDTPAAVAAFTSTSIALPVVTSAVRCSITGTLTISWTVSTTSFVTSQTSAYSTSPTFATTVASHAIPGNVTASDVFLGTGLGTLYARVTANYLSWTGPSAIVTVTGALC